MERKEQSWPRGAGQRGRRAQAQARPRPSSPWQGGCGAPGAGAGEARTAARSTCSLRIPPPRPGCPLRLFNSIQLGLPLSEACLL